MATGSWRCLARWHRATAGTTAVEFALVAPMLLAMILFLISIGYIVFMGQALDNATQKAARQIRTGAVQKANLSQADFRTKVVCAALPAMFSCDNVIVNVLNVPSSGSSHPNEHYAYVKPDQSGLIVAALTNTGAYYCTGAQKTYVYIQVLYPANLMLSMFSTMGVSTTYNGVQTYLLMATATFLNEPFGSGGTTC